MKKLKLFLLIMTVVGTVVLCVNIGNVTYAAQNGLSFNGSSTFIELGDGSQYDSPSQITVEAWAKVNNTNHEMTVVSKAQSGGYGIEYFPSHGSWDWSIYVNGSYYPIYADKPIVVGKWYHLVGTYDGKQSKFYVDGVLQKTVINVTGSIGSDSTTPLT